MTEERLEQIEREITLKEVGRPYPYVAELVAEVRRLQARLAEVDDQRTWREVKAGVKPYSRTEATEAGRSEAARHEGY